MIVLPNGENWENEGENTPLAIAWVRDMFINASTSRDLAQGYEVQKYGSEWFHSKIIAYDLCISTDVRFDFTTNYIIDAIGS
jgi:hypothetical protein